MRRELIVLVVSVALVSCQGTAAAQTLMNPGGFRGGPTVPVPVGGLPGPVGGGPRLEPIKIDLKPTLPLVPTPTVKTGQPNGLQHPDSQVPKLPRPPSPPREPTPDGDVETPEVSGGATVDLPAPAAGQGGQDPSVPSTSSKSSGHVSWWVLIGIGLLVILLYGAKRGGRA